MRRDLPDVRNPFVDQPVPRPQTAGRVRLPELLLGLGVLLSVCMPVRSDAQGGPGMFWTGNDLLAACTGGNQDNRRLCTGYVMAIVDVLAQARNEQAPARACVPFNIGQQRALDVTIGHLQSHPELQRDLGSAAVMAALTAAFPCPR